MTETAATAAPAGWYDDPGDPGGAFRWWSGADWTDHTSPKQAAPAADPYAVPQSYLEYSRDPAARNNSYVPVSREIADYPKGSPNTPGIWLMSFTPLMGQVLGVPAGVLVGLTGIVQLQYIGSAVMIGLAVLFASLDGSELERRGYRRTTRWWLLLLPPIAWLIVRGRSMRKQGATVWQLELVYLGGVAINLLLAFLAAAALFATYR